MKLLRKVFTARLIARIYRRAPTDVWTNLKTTALFYLRGESAVGLGSIATGMKTTGGISAGVKLRGVTTGATFS